MKNVSTEVPHLAEDDFCDLFNDLVDDMPKFREWAEKNVWLVDEVTFILKDLNYMNVLLGLDSIAEYFNMNIL